MPRLPTLSDPAMTAARDFTLDGYRALLAELRARGYAVRGYGDADPALPHLILRHDVDMDLGAAVAMAEVEADFGAASTYFVLMRSELYNPASRENASFIGRLQALGHNVGLHFDATLYPDNPEAQTAAIKTECAALTTLTEAPIASFSFHRPAPSLVGKESPVTGLIAAYAPRYFETFAYVSDSRGGWYYGHPLDHEKVARGVGLHLLTHPIWWVNPGNGPQAKLDRLVADHTHAYRRELAANCKSYKLED
jgi:hypothetical protein